MTHPILKNINWPHDKILTRGKAGLRNLNRELGLGLSEGKLESRGTQPLGVCQSRNSRGWGGSKPQPLNLLRENVGAPWQSPLAPFLERLWEAKAREKLAS